MLFFIEHGKLPKTQIVDNVPGEDGLRLVIG